MMKVKKAKPKDNIVSAAKPMPSVTAPVDDTAGGMHGPGLNVKAGKSYKKGK